MSSKNLYFYRTFLRTKSHDPLKMRSKNVLFFYRTFHRTITGVDTQSTRVTNQAWRSHETGVDTKSHEGK